MLNLSFTKLIITQLDSKFYQKNTADSLSVSIVICDEKIVTSSSVWVSFFDWDIDIIGISSVIINSIANIITAFFILTSP